MATLDVFDDDHLVQALHVLTELRLALEHRTEAVNASPTHGERHSPKRLLPTPALQRCKHAIALTTVPDPAERLTTLLPEPLVVRVVIGKCNLPPRGPKPLNANLLTNTLLTSRETYATLDSAWRIPPPRPNPALPPLPLPPAELITRIVLRHVVLTVPVLV